MYRLPILVLLRGGGVRAPVGGGEEVGRRRQDRRGRLVGQGEKEGKKPHQ